MDDFTSYYGNIAVVPGALRKKRLIKSEKEREPKPQKTVSLKGWCDEKLAVVKGQKTAMAQSIVSGGRGDVLEAWNVEGFKEGVWKRLDKLSPELKETLLPLVASMMEETIYSIDVDVWSKRLDGVDREISEFERRLPPRFSMDLVNVNKFYPASRIGYDDKGRAWDKTLTKYLLGEDSKKKIYFEPFQDWLAENENFYNKVYLVEFQKHAKQSTAPKVEEPHHPEPPMSLAGFYSIGREEGVKEEGEIRSKIYGGRR